MTDGPFQAPPSSGRPASARDGVSAPAADRILQMKGNGASRIDKSTVAACAAIALVLTGSIGYTMFSDPGAQQDRLNLIPPADPSPAQRPDRAALFGGFKAQQPIQEPPIPDDPRFAQFREELEATRRELAALKAAKDKLASVQTVGHKLPDPTKGTAEPSAEVTALTDTLAKLLKEQEKARRDHQRELRALEARIRAQQTGTTASTATFQQAQATTGPSREEIERTEKREKERQERLQRERDRLASSSGGVSIGQNTPSSGDGGSAASTASGNAFIDAASNRAVQTARARTLPDQHRLVSQGTMIGAILETAINSGLPGLLRARVKQDVWSFDGSKVLIPAGATMIGEYSSDISLGQSRVQVIWNRVITPDGRSVQIGSRGVDRLGRAGLTGKVDHNFALKFEAAFLISAVSAIGGLGDSLGNSTASDALSEGGDAVEDASQGALQEYLRIAPTINVDQGDDINVFVARDLYL